MDTIFNAEGCFYRALDDEPVFVLLARDPCAAEAVRWWVTLRQALIGKGQKPLEDHAMLGEALSTAQAMVEWRSDATDPAKYPNDPRWKVEHVPTRDLVEADEIARMQDRIRELEEMISPSLPLDGQPDSPAKLANEIREWVGDRDTERATALLRIAERVRNLPMAAPDSPAAAIAAIGKATGTVFDPMTETMRRADNLGPVDRHAVIVACDEMEAVIRGTTWPHSRKRQMVGFANRIRHAIGEAMSLRTHRGEVAPEESEPADITEVPDMPAHRFAVFDKSDGWAYGRGLEIAAPHIPAMLDRLEADGYVLVSIVGSQADKIGMMFRRVPPAKGTKAPDVAFLGTYDGHAVYVALQTPRHVRGCIASLLQQPCGPEGRGRGLEP